MPGEKQRGGGNVTRIEDYRRRHGKDRRGPPEPPGPGNNEFDEATRDLHAAASTTLKLVFLVRNRLGLPQL